MEIIFGLIVTVAIVVIIVKLSAPKKNKAGFSFETRDQPQPTIEPAHAKPGTFDEAVFFSPKTGLFQFPKYKKDPRYRVQIKDVTDHAENKEYLKCMYEPEERRNYSIQDFEKDFDSFYFEMEVTPFEDFFGKLKKEELSPCTTFYRNFEDFSCLDNLADGDTWQEYAEIEKSENGEQSILPSEDPVTRQLLEEGVLKTEIVEPGTPESLERFLSGLFKKDLVPYCREYGVDQKAKKADMIAALCAKNIPIPEPDPEPEYVITEKGRDYLKGIYRLYVDDLLGNLQRFHPLLIEEIMEAAVDEGADLPGLDRILAEKLEDQFWLKNLCTTPAAQK